MIRWLVLPCACFAALGLFLTFGAPPLSLCSSPSSLIFSLVCVSLSLSVSLSVSLSLSLPLFSPFSPLPSRLYLCLSLHLASIPLRARACGWVYGLDDCGTTAPLLGGGGQVTFFHLFHHCSITVIVGSVLPFGA